jgi:hypothetical protein
MSVKPNTDDPLERAKIELICLGRTLMPHEDNDAIPKIIALILVGLWSAITLALTLEGVDAVAPPYYGLFSALVFLLVGRLWNIEVERLLPTSK